MLPTNSDTKKNQAFYVHAIHVCKNKNVFSTPIYTKTLLDLQKLTLTGLNAAWQICSKDAHVKVRQNKCMHINFECMLGTLIDTHKRHIHRPHAPTTQTDQIQTHKYHISIHTHITQIHSQHRYTYMSRTPHLHKHSQHAHRYTCHIRRD